MDDHAPPPVALTSILNSLHTHLQFQTQLLPTLHAQLGLPVTAIEDELKDLQQRLAECVDARVDARRQQVEEWIGRCESAQVDCTKYCTALGAHAKIAGSSMAERMKEPVLPRRYQLVTEYQEKLRQLYHTKLEQLNTLTNRINALARTLGTSYFPLDMLQPAPTPGETGDNAHRDVTPERFSKLEKELVRGKAEVKQRIVQLHETLVKIDWIYAELGMDSSLPEITVSPPNTSLLAPPNAQPPTTMDTSDPFLCSTPTPMGRAPNGAALLFTNRSDSTSGSDLTPIPSTSAAAEEADHRAVFGRFSARLIQAEMQGEVIEPGMGLEGVDPTPSLLAWAERTREKLENVKNAREAHIQAMYDQLEGLWQRLGVSVEEMDTFMDAHQGSTEPVVAAYEEELERMLDLKRERMGTFVENARLEIQKLWDELLIGEEERADFAPILDDEFTEELLAIHEEEIRRLKEERQQKAHLLVSIRKYFDICEEQKELAAAATDQSRLLGRGPRDPGRLLREEKMRKRVMKEKPRLEQDLMASIPAWEAQAGRPFLVNGESIMAVLEAAAATEAAKDNKRKGGPGGGRASSMSSRATTPTDVGPPSRSTSNASMQQGFIPSKSRGAGGMSGVVIPAVRAAPGLQSGPNKRPRLASETPAARPATRNAPMTRAAAARAAKTPGSGVPRPVPPSTQKANAPRTAARGVAPARSVLQHTQVRTGPANASSTGTAFRFGAAQAPAVAPDRQIGRPRQSFRPRPSEDVRRTSATPVAVSILGRQ